jgi:four helix bundle protein
MKTFRFRDFAIYQDARAFRKLIRTQLQDFPQDEKFRLVDQLYRSSLSIVLNIAEGSAKGTDKDFARFLSMSVASVNEVVAGLDIAMDDGLVTEETMRELESEAERLAKKIGSFIQTLRKSQKPKANS